MPNVRAIEADETVLLMLYAQATGNEDMKRFALEQAKHYIDRKGIGVPLGAEPDPEAAQE